MTDNRIFKLEESENLFLLSFTSNYCLVEKDGKKYKYDYGRFVRKNPSAVFLLEQHIYDLSIQDAAELYVLVLNDFERIIATEAEYPRHYVEFLTGSVAGRCKHILSRKQIDMVADKFPGEYAKALDKHDQFVKDWNKIHSQERTDDWREEDARW